VRWKLTPLPSRRKRMRHYSEDGISLLEYVLLIALVTMAAVGSLLYLGRSTNSPAHAAAHVALGVSGSTGAPGGSGAGGSGSGEWCSSGASNCSDAIPLNGTQYIQITASGGTPPYSYALTGAPHFMTLDSNSARVVINPMNCSQDVGTYNGIAIVVTDSAKPEDTGQLVFSLTVVAKGSSC
jgi:hypothetical protein